MRATQPNVQQCSRVALVHLLVSLHTVRQGTTDDRDGTGGSFHMEPENSWSDKHIQGHSNLSFSPSLPITLPCPPFLPHGEPPYGTSQLQISTFPILSPAQNPLGKGDVRFKCTTHFLQIKENAPQYT